MNKTTNIKYQRKIGLPREQQILSILKQLVSVLMLCYVKIICTKLFDFIMNLFTFGILNCIILSSFYKTESNQNKLRRKYENVNLDCLEFRISVFSSTF